MPRPSNTKVRRGQITLGLMKVMAEKGYDGASMTEVAAAAGLTSGLIHYHFKNKQEILLALLDDLAEGHRDGLEKRLADSGDDPRDQLAAFIDFHIGLGSDANPEALACWLVISAEALRQTEVRASFDRAIERSIQRLVQIIEGGVKRGSFVSDAPQTAACAITAVIQGYFVLAGSARDQIPRGSAATCTKQMAAGLLGFSSTPTGKGV